MNTMSLLKSLPLIVLVVYARLHGMTDIAWKNAFILAGITTFIVVPIQLYQKITMDRLMLGVNVFVLGIAVAFLGEMSKILSFCHTYKGAALLLCIAIVGITATLFTDAGFIDAEFIGQEYLRKKYSYILLGINIIAIIWSVLTTSKGFFVSIVIPFVILRVTYENLIKNESADK